MRRRLDEKDQQSKSKAEEVCITHLSFKNEGNEPSLTKAPHVLLPVLCTKRKPKKKKEKKRNLN